MAVKVLKNKYPAKIGDKQGNKQISTKMNEQWRAKAYTWPKSVEKIIEMINMLCCDNSMIVLADNVKDECARRFLSIVELLGDDMPQWTLPAVVLLSMVLFFPKKSFPFISG